MGADAVDRHLGFTSHEAYCGAKTTKYSACNESIRRRDMKAHKLLHGFHGASGAGSGSNLSAVGGGSKNSVVAVSGLGPGGVGLGPIRRSDGFHGDTENDSHMFYVHNPEQYCTNCISENRGHKCLGHASTSAFTAASATAGGAAAAGSTATTATAEKSDVEKAIQQSLKDQGTAVPDGFFAPVEPPKKEEPAELCTNQRCAQLQATAGNALKMCTVCWKRVAAPSNDSAAVMKAVIQNLFLQLTKGCGQEGCENQHCASAEGTSPLAPNVALPSALAMARNAQSAGISLCVSTEEKLRKKKVEALGGMGFPMRWCAAALERADGSVDAAAAWLCSIETPMA